MLSSFVRHGLTKDEVFIEAMLQIVAGSDTTAIALRCIMVIPQYPSTRLLQVAR